MIFDTHFILFALFWAIVGTGLTTYLTWSSDSNHASVKRYAAITCLLIFLAVRSVLYYWMPVFQGSFFGYFEVLVVTLGISCGMAIWRGNLIPRAHFYMIGAAGMVLVVPVFMWLTTANWGHGNSKRFADLANIRVAQPGEKMPPTDPSHMVLVTKQIAIFKGAQKLQGDIASRYTIDQDSYTLQSVQNHRYWIAPLTLINLGDTLNATNPESPGYVVVDAENPDAEANLKQGYHIKLFRDQFWGLLVNRFVYQHGYTDGELTKPFFEVDDEWQPYWTFGYIKKPFAGMNGQVLDHIVTVNVANEEPDLQVVQPKDRPQWLDRALEAAMVATYAEDWGMYGRGHSNDYWSIHFGWNREGTYQPAEVELNYTTNEHNVYLVPMTATTGAHAVQGVLVFETNRNEAVYYPGLNDFNIGESVRQTMYKVKDNMVGYEVESVQLYSIYGELTWVGIYTAPQANGGRSFAGIGILHAHSQNPADVIFSTSKNTALSKYKNQLATKRNKGEIVSRSADKTTEVTATIGRINHLQAVDPLAYMFVVPGDAHVYRVTPDTFLRIPLVKEGDLVKFSYLDTSETEVAVSTFDCVKCPGMELVLTSDAAHKAPAPENGELSDPGKTGKE